MTLWHYTEKEITIRLSLIALFFCFVILGSVYFGDLIFEGVSRSPATSVIELLSILVNNFLLITTVARTSILGIAGTLDMSLLLKVLFSGVIFLKVLVSKFVLIIGLLWQCTFNTAYTLFINKNLCMSLKISYNEISFRTCFSTFILKLSWESITEPYIITCNACN